MTPAHLLKTHTKAQKKAPLCGRCTTSFTAEKSCEPRKRRKRNSFRAGQCKRETRRNESTEEFIQPFPGIRNHSREEIQSKVARGIAEPYRTSRNRVKPPEQEENQLRPSRAPIPGNIRQGLNPDLWLDSVAALCACHRLPEYHAVRVPDVKRLSEKNFLDPRRAGYCFFHGALR